jgi:DNA-binding NtrC family response regulator
MTDATLTVLVADDQRDVRDALCLFLKSQGYKAHSVQSPSAALAAVAEKRFAVALVDLNYTRDTTSGVEGLSLLTEMKRSDAELPVVVMTAWASIELAVEAMRRGAGDFIEKPWDNTRLASVLRNQVALGVANRRASRLGVVSQLVKGQNGQDFVAESPSMRAVLSLIERVAPTDAAVLLLGENGTGKGMLARRLHAFSERREESLVHVNMGSIAESVFESEMFGHVRGAFTDAKADRLGRIELADGGTLFLDEIANLPHPQQAKLLRVLEGGEFERLGSSRTLYSDARVVSATNVDLRHCVETGRFRPDLLYRLNTVEVRVPPLRERTEDILPLAQTFLRGAAARYNRAEMRLAPSAERALKAFDWPGNVRELMHVMERCALPGSRNLVEAEDLALIVPLSAARPRAAVHTLANAEQTMIQEALLAATAIFNGRLRSSG